MLVINRVELIFCHQSLQVRKLHGDHARRLQQDLHACNEIIQVRHLRQHIVPKQQIRLLALCDQLARRLFSEKFNH